MDKSIELVHFIKNDADIEQGEKDEMGKGEREGRLYGVMHIYVGM